MATAVGLLRDLIVAVIAVLVAFGVHVSNAQSVAIITLVVTGAAFGTWAVKAYKGSP